MRKLKEIWLGQDVINRIILVSGTLACIWCLVKGQGLYGVALVVLMGMLMVSRKSNREKRLGRLYGGCISICPTVSWCRCPLTM